MSLLNVFRSDERALVAVDTLGGAADGGGAPEILDKLFYLPASNSVITGRGILGIAQAVHNSCLSVRGGFDAYADGLAQMCDGAAVWLAQEAQRASVDLQLQRWFIHVALVGWSARASRMVAIQCQRAPGAQSFHTSQVDRDSVAPHEPWSQATGPKPALPLDSPDRMFVAAQAQMKWWHERHPELPTGGHLVIAELKRTTFSVTRRALPAPPVPTGKSTS